MKVKFLDLHIDAKSYVEELDIISRNNDQPINASFYPK
jgi:hypothetical protein